MKKKTQGGKKAKHPLWQVFGIIFTAKNGLYYSTLVLICCCIFIFWSVLLIDESVDCDASLDCFPFDTYTEELLQDYPLNNCTLQSSTNVTVICYKFVFRYVEAIGSVGGVIAFANFHISFYVTIICWMFDDTTSKTEKNIKNILKGLTVVSFLLFPFGGLSGIIVVSEISFLKTAFLPTAANQLKFGVYLTVFLSSSFIVPNVIFFHYKVHEKKSSPARSGDQEALSQDAAMPMDQESQVHDHSIELDMMNDYTEV